jgi:hypothetical protein
MILLIETMEIKNVKIEKVRKGKKIVKKRGEIILQQGVVTLTGTTTSAMCA